MFTVSALNAPDFSNRKATKIKTAKTANNNTPNIFFMFQIYKTPFNVKVN